MTAFNHIAGVLALLVATGAAYGQLVGSRRNGLYDGG